MSKAISGLTNLSAIAIGTTNKKHTAKASSAGEAIAKGTHLISPSVDASSFALSSKLQSNISVLKQAASNVAQANSLLQVAVGAKENILELLTTMKSLTTKANSSAVDDNARSLIDAEYQKLKDQIDNIASQARWSGSSLLQSGGSSATTLANAITASTTGLVDTTAASAFAASAINITSSGGYISGKVTSATATAINGDSYKVELTLQTSKSDSQTLTRTFTGTATVANSGTFYLYDEKSTDHYLNFEFHTDAAGITNAATFNTQLSTALNLDTGNIGASIQGVSTAANNGVGTITASSGTQPGTYSLYKEAASDTVTLTDGQSYWTAEAAASSTITFTNGISVEIEAGYVTATAITDMLFDVDAAGQTSLSFQVAELSTDTLSVSVTSSTAAQFNLTSTDVKTISNAVTAGTSLDDAITLINNDLASLGAQQRQLESAAQNLSTNIENTVAARSTYYDADIPEQIQILNMAKVASQLSNAMLTEMLDLQTSLVSLVR